MDDEARTGKERRKSVRVRMHQHAEIFVGAKGERQPVQIMNISDGGVRFVVNEALPPGQKFVIVLGEDERECKSLHCKELFKGFAIRAEFIA